MARSPFPTTSCSTTVGPPNVSTTTPGSAVGSTSETGTRTCDRGFTETSRVTAAPPPPGITVTAAGATRSLRLVINTVSLAVPSGVDDPSAQYHAFESAWAEGITGPLTSLAGFACPSSVIRSTSAASTNATTTTTRIGHRRSGSRGPLRRGAPIGGGDPTSEPVTSVIVRPTQGRSGCRRFGGPSVATRAPSTRADARPIAVLRNQKIASASHARAWTSASRSRCHCAV